MATRDLTRRFLQLRTDEKDRVLRRKNIVSHREEGNALIESSEKGSTSVVIAPEWVNVVNETNKHVLRIKEMMEKLNKLHTSRLMVRFDGSESKYEHEIDQVTQEITHELRIAEKGLKRMAQSDYHGEFSATDAKTRQNVQRALAIQLQTLSGDFRKSQKTYLARVKNQKEGPVEFDFLAEDETKQKRRSGADTGFTQAQILEVEIAEDVINERDQEIQRIATSITELATIFKELAVLVIDQGTVLDRIDYNMEQVLEQTEKGINELEKAEKTQKNSRPMKCIGLLLILIFIMTVLLSIMEAELKLQQTLMRSLREFVDALRDIKKGKDVNDVSQDVEEAVRVLCMSSETSNSTQWHDEVWKRGLVPIFQRLSLCMARLNQMEGEERMKVRNETLKRAEKPKAPQGLLSLRDYSVLQAAIELLVCWGAHPRVAEGVLMPIGKRRPTRTLKREMLLKRLEMEYLPIDLDVSTDVLMWGYRGYTRHVKYASAHSEKTTSELLDITQTLLQLLSLPQFQPILLPKYVVELFALLIYGEVAIEDTETVTPIQKEFVRLRQMISSVLPLRITMSSLRAVLGQTTPLASEQALGLRFKARCGYLLSRLLMEEGGIVATIETLLGAVDEGNTQARMQVANLICKCPTSEDPTKYAASLCTQVCKLLLAAVSPEKGNAMTKLLGEMAALLADQLSIYHPALFDAHILSVLFHPLLVYEDSRPNVMLSIKETNEEDLTRCVSIARLLICGPPPSERLLQAFIPLIRPIVHMYAFALTSKSFLLSPLQAVLITWIRSCSYSALIIQLAVLPVTLPFRPALLACGYERNYAGNWKPLQQFCAGGSGGISLRLRVEGETTDAIEALKALIMPLLVLLGDKKLEHLEVVGDLFSSLLLAYMHVRKHNNKTVEFYSKPDSATATLELYESMKIPSSAEGVEMVLTLLLALIDSLGPSVLRSAATILQCIGTVLETYTTPVIHRVDKMQQDMSFIQTKDTEDEEGDEILTICLSLVMTILEVGSSERSGSEEQQLRAMLPVLKILSRHPRPEAAELASNARVRILSRGVTETKCVNNANQCFDEVLQKAESDLSSELVPLRARGVVTLAKLVRQSHAHACNHDWTPRVHALARVFLLHLLDSESYVFLAAVQGLAALADVHPDVAIPVLVNALGDVNNSLESRIKLSEALLFSAKRCGETLPKYAKLFVYAYLDCIRPAPSQQKRVDRIQKEASKREYLIQEVRLEEREHTAKEVETQSPCEQELLTAATLRASCLSNLAEVCALLQWGLQPFLMDVLTCVFGILQLELELGAKPQSKAAGRDVTQDDEQEKTRKHLDQEQQCVVTVRRGAVFVLRYLVELLGWKMLELMPDQMLPLYRTFKQVVRADKDAVVIFHATRALNALDNVLRAEVFPDVEQQAAAYSISRLRLH
ncbi:hypothetical protein PsorP6_005745 [Peronosclerospora sorghi]|uniref:Uncharacterized protein n=1 Tax=Peronosclerospora sorghi TaxID=230839 RepID=A0ACC0W5F5_9STRA|nr:hypothetical protein PsorP6_005745 [Peronosclerospora sorghi]